MDIACNLTRLRSILASAVRGVLAEGAFRAQPSVTNQSHKAKGCIV
jgi:hypothetical protein